MNSGGAIDVKALNWVKSEISEAMNQVRQALEVHVEAADPAKLDFIIAQLHQVAGTLNIVELFGAALLTEEMEHLAQALKDERVKQKQDAFEVLTRGILQLPGYLEHLSHGHKDQPLVLMPLLNDLRAACGQPLLSENALFSPDLSVTPAEKSAPAPAGDTRALAKKLRTVYQAALVGLIRGTDLPTQHKKLSFVLSQLDGACTSPMARQLWWTAHGVVESLIDNGLEASISVKSLLGQIDRQLKKVVDHGEDALQSAPPADLVKNLLFYVARSNSQGARVRELKQAFKLAELMPSDNELSQTQNDLLGMNADVMDTVAAALKEDLLSVKETVDLFVRSKDHPLSELEPVMAKLRAVGDTLGILGLGKLRKAIKDQESALKNVVDGTQPLNDDVVMGVAGALLFVESSLSDLSNTGSSGADENSQMPDAEYRSLVALTLREAKAVLTRVKDSVMQFAAQPTAFELLEGVPDLINDIRGALTVVGQERAGDILQLAGQFVSRDVLAQRMPMAQEKLDALADAITGVEYFLESVDDDPVGAQYSLEVARESMARLGHFVPEVAAAEHDEPVVALADEALATDIVAAPQDEVIDILPLADAAIAMPDPAPARLPEPPVAETIAPAAPVAQPAAQAPVARPAEIDPEVQEIFLEEATEECQNIATQLAAWKKNNENDEALKTLRRSFHTIKGSGRIVGAMEIGEFAWAVESMLNRVLDRTIEASPAVFAVLDEANALLPRLVDELRVGERGGVATQHLIDFAQRVTSGEVSDATAIAATAAPVEAAEDIIIEKATPPKRMVDAVLAEIFANETRTHLAALTQFIERCTGAEPACPIDDDLIRALHTLHGSAHMAGIEEIAQVSDALEKWAKLLQENRSTASDYVLTLLSDAVEFVSAVLQDLSDAYSNAARKEELLGRIAVQHQSAVAAQNQRLNTAPEQTASASTAEVAEVDIELVNVFLIEATDLVARSLSETDVWSAVPEQSEYADEIRRRFSTLQGGARISNLTAVARVCSAAAALLTQTLDNPALRGGEVVRLVRRTLEWLSGTLEQIRNQAQVELPESLIEQLESYGAALSLLAPTAPEPEVSAETESDNELINIFLDEATEILHGVEGVLQRWSDTPTDSSHAAELQRALHTLKGGARMARISAIGDLSHEIETLVQRVVDGVSPANAAALELVQASHDWIAHAVEQVRSGVMPQRAADLHAQIEAFYNTSAETEEITITAVEPEPTEPEIVHVMESQVIPFPRAAEPARTEAAPVAAEYDDELVDVFLEEANEITASIDELVAQWANDTGNKDIVTKLQRALHTIKGGARMAKAGAIGDLSHSIESILEGISEGRVKANAKLVDLMHSAYDWLTGALEKVRDKLRVEPATALIHQIEVAVGLRAATEAVAAAVKDTATEKTAAESGAIAAMMEAARAQPTRADVEAEGEVPALQARSKIAEEQVRVGMGLLDQVVNNAGEIAIYRSRIELQHNSIRFNLLEHAQTVNRLREQLRKFEIEAETQILFRYEKTGNTDQEEFDPLELDRFSNMQQLSRSLVESVGDLGSIQKLLENLTRESEILLLQQSRVTSSLQDGLMRTRLVPFASVVPRLRRIVRQTSKELGKDVELIVAGAEGEMDRSVLNRLTPALEHMLRNAVDHGIETPEKRRKSGKEGGGSVTLRFWREGPEIVLTIADDGAGMDLKAIRKKAIEKGLMEDNSDLGPNEITQFVLEAGFSTASKVTQISGRGVGMDVVNNEIRQLNGTLKIDTEKGKGTTFMVRLPLTVSVNQALIVHAGEQTYAIPLSSIDGVVRIGRDDLDNLHKDEHLPYEYAGVSYKFFHLGSVLNVSQPALPDEGIKIPLILARAGDHRVALQVEAIAARQEVVIKSVGPQMSTVIGISGATILNDGGVALILDLASLIRAGIAHGKRTTEAPVLARVSTVMIVDDSITVRKVTDRLLKRHNFETLTAKDGVDALAQLQEHVPDLMLLDIEMPRMDGYELATAMRNDERLKRIPIIMITSRTGDKHRERAMAIGVNMYMGKPFQENELLENINKLLNERR